MSDNYKPDIWKLQSQLNTQGLVDALTDQDAGIRRRAATALRALGAFHAIPNLEAALETESDPETRSNIVSALDALQQEKARQENGGGSTALTETERLIKKLEEETDPEVIMQTAKTLGTMGDKLAVPKLMARFTDPEVPIKVRLVVAEALLNLESAPVEVTLLAALRSDDWRVRRNGAAILGQLKAIWAVEPLAQALYDKSEHVRKTAFAALRHIGSDEAKQALQRVRDEVKKKKSPPPPADPGDLKWPSSPKPKPENPNLAPTKPLDPKVVENLKSKEDDNQ